MFTGANLHWLIERRTVAGDWRPAVSRLRWIRETQSPRVRSARDPADPEWRMTDAGTAIWDVLSGLVAPYMLDRTLMTTGLPDDASDCTVRQSRHPLVRDRRVVWADGTAIARWRRVDRRAEPRAWFDALDGVLAMAGRDHPLAPFVAAARPTFADLIDHESVQETALRRRHPFRPLAAETWRLFVHTADFG
jgi:hypothetical protein